MSKVVRAASVALVAIFAIVPASKGTTHRGIDGSGADGSLDRRSLSARMTQMYSQLPISFEPNRGQTDPRVKFLARGAGYGLFLTPTEGRLVLRSADTHSLGADAHLPGTRADSAQHSAALSMQFVGANPAPAVQGIGLLPGTANYFIGNDPARWRAGIPTYAQVRYVDLYPGIDLTFSGTQGRLEYSLRVAPGADPGAFSIALSGADDVSIDGVDERPHRRDCPGDA